MCVCMFHVQLKRVSILKKYDEEIEGEKKSSFALGEMLQIRNFTVTYCQLLLLFRAKPKTSIC